MLTLTDDELRTLLDCIDVTWKSGSVRAAKGALTLLTVEPKLRQSLATLEHGALSRTEEDGRPAAPDRPGPRLA